MRAEHRVASVRRVIENAAARVDAEFICVCIDGSVADKHNIGVVFSLNAPAAFSELNARLKFVIALTLADKRVLVAVFHV